MIYLIETTYYNKETKEVLDLLKIGYTEDNKKDFRYSHYRLHNPGFQLLYEIPGYNEDIERRIQYKFRNLKYNEYGHEWFYYSEEIINFFKEIDKIDLYSLPKNIGKKLKGVIKDIRIILEYVLRSDELEEYLSKLILQYGDDLNKEVVLNYLKNDGRDLSKYYEIISLRESGKFTDNEELNIKIKKILEEYESLTDIQDKYKLLCESPYPEEVIKIVVNQLHDSDPVKGNYSSLGPQKLKALNYRKGNIQKALGIVTFNPLLLQNHIYQDFKVGDKLSLAEIKLKLSNIYSEINYDKTPKANDIENYFEIKEISSYEKNPDGSRKKIRMYELLSQKHVLVETKTD